jgi:hypothetical protein
LYHGRDTRAHALPEDELNAYVARRMEMVRIGDSTPINIRLADGKVLRFSCTVLPDGGRMLSYTPVTDLIRDAAEAAKPEDDEAEDYLSLRDLRFVPPLHAAE